MEPQFNVNTLQSDLWCIPAELGSKIVYCYVDSGAQTSVIKTSIFQKLPAHLKPKVKKWNGQLKGVDGLSCNVLGYTRLPMLISGRVFDVDLLVADIKPDCLLGLNFLRDHKGLPDFSKGEIKFGDFTVILRHKPSERTCRVSLVHNVTIEPHTEQVVHLRASNKRAHLPNTAMLTPLKRFTCSSDLILGRSLVNPNEDQHVPVIVVNASEIPISLSTGFDIALAHPVSSLHGSIPQKSNTPAPDAKPTEATALSEQINDTALSPLDPTIEKLVLDTQLSDSNRDELRTVLTRHEKAFQIPGRPLGVTPLVQHSIDTGDSYPVKLRTRRLAAKQHELADTHIKTMLEDGVIEESYSPWASPIVLTKKKDGTTRFCVDYRKLNSLTRKDSYPLPNIEDTFQTVAGSEYFCALDLASSYNQVALDDDAKPKSAFTSRQGLFQYNVMPYGLCNAPATFERLMERIFRGHLGERCLAYIDDVIVFGRDFATTLHNLDIILSKFVESNFQLKPKKCKLFQKKILFLGFELTGTGISSDPDKIDKVKNWPRPCNVRDVRSFLGLASYMRRFIQNFAKVAHPLTELTKKTNVFTWGADEQNAFDALKHALCVRPVLDHARPDCPFVLDTDASAFALGGVLSQIVDGKERVIAYASQTLSKSQRNYCTTHRELLAVVQFTKKFKHYLWGRHFLIRTDHSSLRWLMNYKDADGMLARWLLKLQEYNFTIEHRAGSKHGNADALSRCHSCKNPACPAYAGLPQPPPRRSRKRATSSQPTPDCPRRNRLEPTITDPTHNFFTGPVPTVVAMPLLTTPQQQAARNLDRRLSDLPWLNDMTIDDIAAAQQLDANISPVYTWIENNETPDKTELGSHSEETKCLYSRDELYRRACQTFGLMT